MIRKLFTFAAAVSLTLCLGTVVSWAVAYWHPRTRMTSRWTDQPRQVDFEVREVGWNGRGVWVKSWEFQFRADTSGSLDPVRQSIATTFGAAGLEVTRWDWRVQWTAPDPLGNGGCSSSWHTDVYLWYSYALGFAALPAMWVVIMWAYWYGKRGAERRSACKRCGYNLTGNVSGVCPECGTAVGNVRAIG